MKLLSKLASLSVGLAMAVGVGVAISQKAEKASAIDTDAYNISSTPLTALSNGKKVIWGSSTTNIATATISSNWLRMSSTASDWAIYEVTLVSGSYYLKNGSNYIYSSAVKKMAFSSSDKTAITLGTGGIVQATGLGVYVYNDNNGDGGIRPYASVGTMSSTYLYEVTAKATTQYTVTFNSNGGSSVASQTVNAGSTATQPANPTKTDYTFGGWYTDNNTFQNQYNFSTAVNSDLTLYAKWNAQSSGGESYKKVTVEPSDWSGEYLLVYEASSTSAYVWTGVDAASAYVSATISSSSVDKPDGAASLIIESMTGGYSIRISGGTKDGKYISGTSGSNTINYGNSAVANTMTYSSDVDIVSNTSHMRFNNSNNQFRYFKAATYTGQKAVQLYKLSEDEKTIVASKMTVGTVSASTGDDKWTLEGFSFEVLYDGDSSYTDVTSKTTFSVTESVPTISADGTLPVHVTPTYNGDTYSDKTAEVTANLHFVNLYSIERLYTLGAELGKSETYGGVEFDGIYMGYVSGRGVFVMNGEYGMLVFKASDSSSYVVGETYLTVSGSLCTYNHLYEIAEGATVSELTDTDRKANVAAPKTYVVDGTETASTRDRANRKTSLSGTVAGIKVGNNDRVDTVGTKATANNNNTIYVTVGGNEVMLYLTSANATSEVANKIEVGKKLTAEGFSIYFSASNVATFEVLFENLVEASDYGAADFAKDLLKLTKGTCNSSYDGVTDNSETLTGIWTTLAGANYWLKVQAAGEDDQLVNGTPDESIVVPTTDETIDAMSDANAIAAALYRYDYCTAKYKLTNFIGRSLTVSFSQAMDVNTGSSDNSSYIVIIIVIIASIALDTIVIAHKKRKFKK